MRAPHAIAQYALTNIRVAADDETGAIRKTMMKDTRALGNVIGASWREAHIESTDRIDTSTEGRAAFHLIETIDFPFLVQLGGLEPPTS